MDVKIIVSTFGLVFLAELGDKTQLATMLFASKAPENLLAVFIGASAALILASGIGVLAGGVVSQFLGPKSLSIIAGAGFLAIGAWTIYQGIRLH